MTASYDDLLAGYPEPVDATAQQVREAAGDRRRVLIVLDDDPTGTQSVADLPVLTDWSVESMVWALQQERPAVYVMTNSRSVDPEVAAERNREVARAAFAAADRTGHEVDFVSRSDSTMRGHFPLEPNVLADCISERGAGEVDGIVIVPDSAGRITVGSALRRQQASGFSRLQIVRPRCHLRVQKSRLAEWVEEKSASDRPTVIETPGGTAHRSCGRWPGCAGATASRSWSTSWPSPT